MTFSYFVSRPKVLPFELRRSLLRVSFGS